MIALEYQPRPARNHLDQAGMDAEVRLAHYFARGFGQDPRVQVYFGLRLEAPDAAERPSAHRGGAPGPDRVQMDVLIVHKHGMAIVESKSVHAEVCINARGEWSRTYKGAVHGMESPIEQVRRQATALIRILDRQSERLLDRMMFGQVQARFGGCPVETFVAISDKGRIVREGDGDVAPEAMKADQIAARVRGRIERHREAGSVWGMLRGPLSSTDGVYKFRAAELERIRAFLLEQHRG